MEPTDNKKVTRAQASSNACLATQDNNQAEIPFSRILKDRLKEWRIVYRMVNGIRALREGLHGVVLRKRGAVDHVRSTISFMAGSEKIRGRPMNITIEPTNTCNLHCPVCETGAGVLGRAPKHMTLQEFKTIIDKIASHTNTLMFYFMGEPFINKSAYDMIRYAKAKGIPYVMTCTNGDFVDPQQLVDSGIDEVSFQIGGLTQKTHETYRVNSNLDRVLKNLRETVRVKKEKQSKLKVYSGFILMKHNEHEVDLFKQTMTDIGVDDAIVIDPCVRTIEEGKTYLPSDKSHWFYNPEAFDAGVLKPRFLPPNECPWISYSMSIHVTGNVVPCCRDPLGKHVMGNILTQSFEDIWNGEAYRAFRNKLHADQSQLDICKLCSAYPPSQIK